MCVRLLFFLLIFRKPFFEENPQPQVAQIFFKLWRKLAAVYHFRQLIGAPKSRFIIGFIHFRI
jgi:hypothetical protein